MRVRWSPDAAEDLASIYRYQKAAWPARAQTTVTALYSAIMSLPGAPHKGRPGRNPGTRELVISPMPYLIVYRVEREAIQIVRIRHASQGWTQ